MNKNRYVYLGILLALSSSCLIITCSNAKERRLHAANKQLDEWPYLYYKALEAKESKEGKKIRIDQFLDFYDDLISEAWKIGLESSREQKKLSRSRSSNELFALFKTDNGERIYSILGSDDLHRPGVNSNTLNLKELLSLREKIHRIRCTHEGSAGELLKAHFLLDIQKIIKKHKA